mgnify:CR=1 FL=1
MSVLVVAHRIAAVLINRDRDYNIVFGAPTGRGIVCPAEGVPCERDATATRHLARGSEVDLRRDGHHAPRDGEQIGVPAEHRGRLTPATLVEHVRHAQPPRDRAQRVASSARSAV